RFSRDWSSDVCSSDLCDQVPALLVDGADPIEEVVVLPDFSQPFPRDAPTAGDILQERDNVFPLLRTTEGDQQKRVIGPHGPIKRSEERRVGKESRCRW